MDWDNPVEKVMTTPSSILAWRIIMDRGAWRVTVPGVAKSRTRLSNWAQCTLSYVLSRLWSQELFNMPPPKQQTLKHELMFIHFDSLACSVIQSCMTLCNPMDYIVHQALLSMTFSKQEYWSELPFLSPDILVTQLYPTICGPIDYSPSSSYVNWISQARILEVGCHSLPQGLFQTHASNPGFLHCRQILYHLSHQAWFQLSRDKNMIRQRDSIFILFIRLIFGHISKIKWKKLNPSKDEWIKKLWYTYSERFLNYKNERNPAIGTTWIELESIMLSEMPDREKKYSVISHVCKIWKKTELVATEDWWLPEAERW